MHAQVSEDERVDCFLGGDLRDSEVFSVNARAMMTDEVLAAEASRYDYFPAIFGGDRDIFSSTPSRCDRALVVGGVSGSKGVDNVEGVGFQAPLCVVLTDGSPWVMDTEGEKSLGDKLEVVEALQEREVLGSSWDESSLVKFRKSLGFTIEGVEGEILKLLLRLKSGRDQGKKRGTLGLTRFDQEVKS